MAYICLKVLLHVISSLHAQTSILIPYEETLGHSLSQDKH